MKGFYLLNPDIIRYFEIYFLHPIIYKNTNFTFCQLRLSYNLSGVVPMEQNHFKIYTNLKTLTPLLVVRNGTATIHFMKNIKMLYLFADYVMNNAVFAYDS